MHNFQNQSIFQVHVQMNFDFVSNRLRVKDDVSQKVKFELCKYIFKIIIRRTR